MALAYQCDSCGNFYLGGSANPVGRFTKAFEIELKVSVHVYYARGDFHVDLCPKCVEKILCRAFKLKKQG